MAGPIDVRAHIDHKRRPDGMDARIAELAEAQHGVVSRRQLEAVGMGAGAINRRLLMKRLHPLHRGVYAVGHLALTRESRWLAAALAVGPDAALSDRSAGALWKLGAWTHQPQVTTPRAVRRREGVEVHRRPLPPDEIRVVCGIPVTCVPRTLLDLAATLDSARLERSVEQAVFQRLDDELSIADMLERYPSRPGRGRLGKILERADLGLRVTRSELEKRFLEVIRRARLPLPANNLFIQSFEVDCVWWDQRLIVELDSRRAHETTFAFERDRARDRALQTAGWTVVRITWRQLHEDPRAVVRDLRLLLQRAA
jgi:very-short-patch-repair endonuclease